jgi:hypothetical protein
MFVRHRELVVLVVKSKGWPFRGVEERQREFVSDINRLPS